MEKLFPSLKNRHWTVYFFLALYSLTAAFTIGESCLPGDLSSAHSGFIGNIIAWFANLFPSPSPSKVEPIGIELAYDSSYLDQLEGTSDGRKVCLGTTTMLQFNLEFPEATSDSYRDKSFEAYELEGGENFNLVVDSANAIVRIVSDRDVDEDCSIEIRYGSEGSFVYDFSIVDRPAPLSFEIDYPTSVQAGTAVPLDISILDTTPRDLSDYELRRYLDVEKLEIAADDGLVVDPRGYIYAERDATPGPKSFSIGGIEGEIAVTSSIGAPTYAGLTLEVETEGQLAINDYDYDDSGVSLAARLEGDGAPSDPLFVVSLDEMMAKPVRTGNSTFDIKGYRMKATVEDPLVVTVSSAVQDEAGEPLFSTQISLLSNEIAPETIVSVSMGGSSLKDGDTFLFNAGKVVSVSASFLGEGGTENVYDRSIEVTLAPSSLGTVSGNRTLSPTVSFPNEGHGTLTVRSVANPELALSVEVTVDAPVNVDPTDDDFGTWVRKNIGHMGLFAFMSAIGGIFFALYFASYEKAYLTLSGTSLVSTAIAFLTEGIQTFVPGRTGALSDVGIDLFGALIGILAFLLVYAIVVVLRERPWSRKKGRTDAK